MRRDLPCPVCGARGAEPCTTFDTIGPGVFGPRYHCEPHSLRPIAETYWRAARIRERLYSQRANVRDYNDRAARQRRVRGGES